ncbi:ogr/Delta-like zinc finger family protein [Dechloromonas denitrificans]|uniref:ogr/Delta-like zinc finger family protein n=1 Tax=Dechloromonas denitrificans TaxID=281362 RepID=UPI001CF8772E|nr:ogr/Delta-like zinc finger family protein [Dechloromonas denitrificans]UCV02326.1 ogr/Delta-like zinc finger family protein [Dechloromonas denitrificans]
MRLKCPHCGSDATIRSSRTFSEITREASVQCNNIECAHTWVAQISAVRTIAPSMTPNPKVYIPVSPRSPVANKAGSAQLELGMDHPPPRLATG